MRKFANMPSFLRIGIWSFQITPWGSNKIIKSQTLLMIDAAILTTSVSKQRPSVISTFQNFSRGLHGKIVMKAVIKWKIEVLQITRYVRRTMRLFFLTGANICRYWRSNETWIRATVIPCMIEATFMYYRVLAQCNFQARQLQGKAPTKRALIIVFTCTFHWWTPSTVCTTKLHGTKHARYISCKS